MGQFKTPFDKKYPSPLDRLIFPIWRDYRVMAEQAISIWALRLPQSTKAGSARIEIVKNRAGKLVSVMSVVSEPNQLEDDLYLYQQFFTTYKKFVDSIVASIQFRILMDDPFRSNRTERKCVSRKIALLYLMVEAMLFEHLTLEHLDTFAILFETTSDEERPVVVDALKTMFVGTHLSTTLAVLDQGLDYNLIVTSRLVGAFWQYACLDRSVPETTPVQFAAEAFIESMGLDYGDKSELMHHM